MKTKEYNLSKIKKEINRYEWISFDIFDTLIKRNVKKPTDIFEIVELRYQQKYNVKIKDFKNIRILAEKQAIENNIIEPNLDDIYKYIDLDKELYNIDELKNIEINVEYMICQQNKDFYEVYKYALEKNKKIIVTSDMYLPLNVIKNILFNAEIKKFDYIFLSNEIKMNKRTGEIYNYILNFLNINHHQILHIGDSLRGDYLLSRYNKIKSICIPKKIQKSEYMYHIDKKKEDINYNVLSSFMNNNTTYKKGVYYKIGYEILGPLLYGFSKWLVEEVKKNEIKKIFFLSREGALLKKGFEILNKNSDIEIKYLYVSRRSTRTFLLKNIETLEDVFNIVKMRNIITVKDFLNNVGLEPKKYKDLYIKYDIDEFDNIKKIDNFEKIFEEIKQDIIDNAIEEEKNISGYLKQEKFYGKIALVDVGWTGTMQNALINISKYENFDTDIIGFYMAQNSNAINFIKSGMKTKAYLFDYTSNRYNDEIRLFLNLFESFFLAQHGTTLKYEKVEQNYIPVLAECEYSKDEILIFEKIQRGAIEFINDYKKIDFFISSDVAYANIYRLGVYPKLKEVNLFSNISYLETSKNAFANPRNIIFYLLNPKKLYYDFSNASWKIGFVKKMLKIKMNYRKLISFIYSKF